MRYIFFIAGLLTLLYGAAIDTSVYIPDAPNPFSDDRTSVEKTFDSIDRNFRESRSVIKEIHRTLVFLVGVLLIGIAFILEGLIKVQKSIAVVGSRDNGKNKKRASKEEIVTLDEPLAK